MSEELLKNIESKLDALIDRCTELEMENTKLKLEYESWNREKARLIEKNEYARKRVEAMIEHLKTVEASA